MGENNGVRNSKTLLVDAQIKRQLYATLDSLAIICESTWSKLNDYVKPTSKVLLKQLPHHSLLKSVFCVVCHSWRYTVVFCDGPDAK